MLTVGISMQLQTGPVMHDQALIGLKNVRALWNSYSSSFNVFVL